MDGQCDDVPCHRLSASITPVFKTVIVALLSLAAAYATWASVVVFGLMGLVLVMPFDIFTGYLVVLNVRLRKVVACKDRLIIGGYFRSVSIPFEEIVGVQEMRARGFIYVTLRTVRRSRFGSSIHFLVVSSGLPNKGRYGEFLARIHASGRGHDIDTPNRS